MGAQTRCGDVQRFEISTRDPEETEAFVREVYIDNRTRFGRMPQRARFSSLSVLTPQFSADHICTSASYVWSCQPFDYYLFVAMADGELRMRDGSAETVVPAGECSVYTLGVELEIEVMEVDIRTLRMPAARLRDTAQEITDSACEELRVLDPTPVSASMARHWSAVMRLLNNTALSDDPVLGAPLLTDEMLRYAATAALHTFPNTAMQRWEATGASRSGQRTLSRAVAYIEANAEQALTVAQIAEATGASARSLRYAFSRHLDTTPIAHLQRVRLQRAHDEMQSADPATGASVADIARRWGFGPRTFIRRYCETYGHLPGQTLRG